MKIFSPNLKRQLKDCILAILWPRKDIYTFFRDCNCPTPILKRIGDGTRDKLSRAQMIDEVFDGLASQPCSGTLQFNLMVEVLCDWTHFDDYWFKVQKKLDLGEANKKIASLKAAKERSLDNARERIAKQETQSAAREQRHASLEEMRSEFQSISTGSETPQQRGYAFEKFISKMARFFGLKVTEAFRITGTQVDGSIKFDGENYNLEAKWEHQQLSDEPLMAFCHKQEINMHGRGIFISVNGYTKGALSMLMRASIKNTVLFDGEDIVLILSDLVSLPEALDRKIHAAQTRGEFFVNPITGKSKIKL